MNNTKEVYCRLCAELKPQNELTNMQTDEETCQKVVKKLSRFNIVMDFRENILPMTVCVPCVNSLEGAFTFITAVEHAQALLNALILVKSSTLKHDVCGTNTFFASTESDKEMIDIKVENRQDPMDVADDEINLGEECDDGDVFSDDGKNASNEEVSMKNKVVTESFYVTVEEKVDCKDETIVENVENIEENESPNFSNECKYNQFNNVTENDLNINDTEMRNEKCINVEPKKEHKSIKSKHKKPVSKSVPTEQDSVEFSEEYINKQINRLSIVPVQYLKKTWLDYEWKCSHCETMFANIEELQKHSLQYHNICNAYACNDCHRKKQRLNAFIKHVRSHKKYLHYSCYKCFEKFSNVMDTRKHKKEIHENSKHVCVGCNTPFSSKAELEEHVKKFYNLLWKRHTADNNDNLTCGTCLKIFQSKYALRKHSMKHTLNKMGQVCDRCGKCFDTEPKLRNHMIIHSERLSYQCEICKAKFINMYTLKYHSSIHSGVKPFTCDICSRSFRTKSQITNHMKFHSDSFPYPCTVCTKKFRTPGNFKNHMRQHSGAKPFSCDICQRDFTNLSNRNKHMRRRHGIEMAKKRQPIIKLPTDEQSSSDLATEDLQKQFIDLDKLNAFKNSILDHRRSQNEIGKIRKGKVISKEPNEN